MTNTPDKSETVEQRARGIYDQSPDVFWNSHSETRGHRHWGDLTEERREHFRDIARASSRPPADQVPDVVERLEADLARTDCRNVMVQRTDLRAVIAALQAVPAASEVGEIEHWVVHGVGAARVRTMRTACGKDFRYPLKGTDYLKERVNCPACAAALKASGEEKGR